MAEREATNYLEDISLNKKYYDRNITWSMKKTFWDSWVEISVPTRLLSKRMEGFSDVEDGHISQEDSGEDATRKNR